jgi:hypothetical protein
MKKIIENICLMEENEPKAFYKFSPNFLLLQEARLLGCHAL